MAVAYCRFEFAHTPVLTNVCGNPGFALKLTVKSVLLMQLRQH